MIISNQNDMHNSIIYKYVNNKITVYDKQLSKVGQKIFITVFNTMDPSSSTPKRKYKKLLMNNKISY